jgi:glycosyltransferase involved in cell wall biosynthesis
MKAGLAFEDTGALLHMDVSTLLERQWTGIPIVAAGLAGAILARLPDRTRFFLGPSLVDTALVADALGRNTGLFLSREIDAGSGLTGRVPVLTRGTKGAPSVGLFPSVKPLRRLFDVEASLLHDLSTLVLPYFHIKGNVDHHMATLLADIASNDVTVSVSEASQGDLQAYLGVPSERLMVVPNGVAWPYGFEVEAGNALAPMGAEPYLLILGTREPRKNILLVFEMLARAPALLATHRFVFVGKMGWLEEQHALPPSLEPAVRAGRILFTGFVGDAAKYRLLAGAEATIYPSLFEGFGLPVLESLSAGTPCVASWSSSIPEVGGGLCSYFDPFSAADMHRALLALLARRCAEGARLSAACKAHAAEFTWDAAADRILARLAGLVAQNAGPRSPRRRLS